MRSLSTGIFLGLAAAVVSVAAAVACGPTVTPECDADEQCQIVAGAGGDTCTSGSDCAGGEACVPGYAGDGYCLITGDTATCELEPGFTSISVDDTDGNAVDVCVDDAAICAEDSTCA